jgi:hypothetical protein
LKRKIKIAAFVLLLVVLGFLREYLFVAINSTLYFKYVNEINLHPFAIEKYLGFFSYSTLYTAKWFITPLSAFVFWLVQKQFLFFLFADKKPLQWLNALYALLFILAALFFAAGWALGNVTQGYTFSRLFMGLLQSPVACMILIPLMYLHKNKNAGVRD